VLGVAGKVGQRGLVDVEHPLLAGAGEVEALRVGDGLVDDGARVPPVLPAHHVVPHVALAVLRDGASVAQVVRLHAQPPAVARHARAPAQVLAGRFARPEHVDQRQLLVEVQRELPCAGGAGDEDEEHAGGEEELVAVVRRHCHCCNEEEEACVLRPCTGECRPVYSVCTERGRDRGTEPTRPSGGPHRPTKHNSR
jgi:hypothetical protein